MLRLARALLLVPVLAWPSPSPPTNPCFAESFERGLGPRWREKVFEAPTAYSVVDRDGSKVLQAVSASASSALGVEISCPVRDGTSLSWRWRATNLPTAAGIDKLSHFDHVLRVTLLFKSTLGAPRSINYVWSNSQPLGATYSHPKSGRARFLVLRSGPGALGQWLQEKRDVSADWRALFGDSPPPDLVGIALMTDSDGTDAVVTGYYDDLLLH